MKDTSAKSRTGRRDKVGLYPLLSILLVLGAALFILRLNPQGSVPDQEGTECELKVGTDLPLREAIAEGDPRDKICLPEGTWRVELKIDKSLTLSGAGTRKTVLKSSRPERPIIWAKNERKISPSLTLAHLKLSGASGDCPHPESGDCGAGLLVGTSGKVNLSDCLISNNSYGLWLYGSARAKLLNCTLSFNNYGLASTDRSGANLSSCRIVGNFEGVSLWNRGEAEITGCPIRDNTVGIGLHEGSRAEVANTTLTSNQLSGIWRGRPASRD